MRGGEGLRRRHHQPGQRQAVFMKVWQRNELAGRSCTTRVAVSEHRAELIRPRLFELKISPIGQALGQGLAVSLLIEIESKAMRSQVRRYPFFIESERGQVQIELFLAVRAVFES